MGVLLKILPVSGITMVRKLNPHFSAFFVNFYQINMSASWPTVGGGGPPLGKIPPFSRFFFLATSLMHDSPPGISNPLLFLTRNCLRGRKQFRNRSNKTDCRRLHSWSFTIDVIDIFLKSAIQFLQNHCQHKQMSSLNPGAIDDNADHDYQRGIK